MDRKTNLSYEYNRDTCGNKKDSVLIMNNSKNTKKPEKKTREGVSSQFIKKVTAELLAVHLEKNKSN